MSIDENSVNVLLLLFLLFLRCYALLIVVPVTRALLGVAGMASVSIALALGLLATQKLSFGAAALIADKGVIEFTLMCARELIIGLLIGAPLALVLEVLVMTGRIADVSRGAQFGEQLVPAFGKGLSPGERIATFGVAMMAVSSQGYSLVFSVLRESLQSVNPGSLVNQSSMGGLGTLVGVEAFIDISTLAITQGLLLASPVVLVSFLLDVGASILSRAMGRVNIVVELMPLKLLLGFGLLSWLLTQEYLRVYELEQIVASTVMALFRS